MSILSDCVRLELILERCKSIQRLISPKNFHDSMNILIINHAFESHVFDVSKKLNLKNLLSEKVLVPQGIHNGVSIVVVIQRKLFGHHLFGLVVSKTITLNTWTSEKKRDTALSAVGTKKELFLCTPSKIVPLIVKVVKYAK